MNADIFKMLRPCHQIIQHGGDKPENNFLINHPEIIFKLNNIDAQSTNKTGLLLLNEFVNQKHVRGMYLYLFRTHKKEDVVIFEFYNLIKLCNFMKQIFSNQLWETFKSTIESNSKNFASQQLYLAYESLAGLFLMTNLSKMSVAHLKTQYEFGDLLFHFNPYSRNKEKKPNSARSTINRSIARSEDEIRPKIMAGLKIVDDAIIGNYLVKDQLVFLE